MAFAREGWTPVKASVGGLLDLLEEGGALALLELDVLCIGKGRKILSEVLNLQLGRGETHR